MVTAAASRCPKLVVPTHFHPAVRSMGWTAAAERSRHVRLTVANGVGEKRHEAFRRPWRRCGAPVSPWSARGHGTTAAGSLRRGLLQVTRYRDWWGAMDGVFVDRVTTEANEVSHYAALSLRLVNSKRGPRRSTPRESCEKPARICEVTLTYGRSKDLACLLRPQPNRDGCPNGSRTSSSHLVYAVPRRVSATLSTSLAGTMGPGHR
jgi:hypothetical protein